MDYGKIKETIIKPKLASLFGNLNASVIVQKYSSQAIMKANNEKEKLTLLVNGICNDKQVVGIWGMAQATRHKQEWLKLV